MRIMDALVVLSIKDAIQRYFRGIFILIRKIPMGKPNFYIIYNSKK